MGLNSDGYMIDRFNQNHQSLFDVHHNTNAKNAMMVPMMITTPYSLFSKEVG